MVKHVSGGQAEAQFALVPRHAPGLLDEQLDAAPGKVAGVSGCPVDVSISVPVREQCVHVGLMQSKVS